MSIPSVTVEATVGSGGAWEDISRYVIKDGASLTITRGRSGGGAAQPGVASFALANGDGRFSESNPASPYAAFWKPTRKAVVGAGVRITVNDWVRFVGNLQACPTSWPSHPLAVTNVTAVDVMARLNAAPVAASSADAVVAGLGARCWWALNDKAGTPVVRDRKAGYPLSLDPGRSTDGAVWSFGTAAPEGLRAGTQMRLTAPVGTATRATAYGSVPGSSLSTFTLLAIVTPLVSAVAGSTDGKTASLWINVGTPGPVSLHCNPDLSLGTSETASVEPGFFTIGRPSIMALAVTPSGWRLLGTPFAGASSPSVAPWGIEVRTDNGGSALFSHVAILQQAMTESQYRMLQTAAIEGGDLASQVTTILQASIDAAGITATVQALGHDRFMLAPDFAQTPASLGEQMAQAAGALYVADRATGDPTWIDHHYVGPVTDIAPRMLRRDGVTWGSDPNGTDSQNVPELMPADMRDGYLRWLDNTADLMDAARLTGWQFDLARMADPDHVEALLALDLKHRLRFWSVGVPSQLPPEMRTLTLEGYTETISFPVGGGDPTWTITPTTAPDPRFILGDAVQGVLGATADNRLGY